MLGSAKEQVADNFRETNEEKISILPRLKLKNLAEQSSKSNASCFGKPSFDILGGWFNGDASPSPINNLGVNFPQSVCR